MAYQAQTPFHVVGTRTASLTNLDEALQKTGLDWQIDKRKLYLADGTEFKGHFGMVRLNGDGSIKSQLGAVGAKYHPTTNRQNVEMIEPLLSRFGCTVESGGTFNGGRRCFLLLKFPGVKIDVVPGDSLKGFNLLSWNHDGQGGVRNNPTTIRPICANTLAAAAAQCEAWAMVQHRAGAAQRIDEAAKVVEQIVAAMIAAGESFAALARARMTRSDLQAFVERIIPSEAEEVSTVIRERRESIVALASGGRGADMANQLVSTVDGGVSLWGAINGVSEYFDHVRPAEAKSEATRLKANESALFGGNALVKQLALAEAQRLLGAN
jgi:phage/plasmid-like protein (TIGR03299 family)